jgi:hypothetical protein
MVGVPNENFLSAIASAFADLPLASQMQSFYDEAKNLSHRFSNENSRMEVLDPYAGLVPVLHHHIAATSANQIKHYDRPARGFDILCPLPLELRRDNGAQSFVQGNLVGFRRNWDIFADFSLSGMN